MKRIISIMVPLLCCCTPSDTMSAAHSAESSSTVATTCTSREGACQPGLGFILPKPVYNFAPHDDPSSRDSQVSVWIDPEQGSLSRSRLSLIESYNGNPSASPVCHTQLSESTRFLNSFIVVSDAVNSANRGCLLLQQTLRNLTPCKDVIGLPKPINLNYSAQEKAICGGALMHVIRDSPAINSLDLTGKQPPFLEVFTGNLEAYLHSIVDLTFYMYTEAINKGQPFTDGTFVVLDKDLKLWNFLMYYCRARNSDLTGTLDDTQLPGTLNAYACCRASSHFQYAQKYTGGDINPRHYGIDIRFEKGSSYECASITEMPHILFGLVGKTCDDTPVLFIKLEDAGVLLSWEWVMHSFGFIGSKARKAQANCAPDSTQRKRLKYYFGSDDGYGKQKERTSLHFMDSCKHIVKYSQCPKWVMGDNCPTIDITGLVPTVCSKEIAAALAKDLANLKEKGVKELAFLIDNKPEHWTPELHKAFIEFYEGDTVLNDYPGARTGDEVIIGEAEYQSCPFYFWMLKALQMKNNPNVRSRCTDLAWVCEQMYENERNIYRCQQALENFKASIERIKKYKTYLFDRVLVLKMQQNKDRNAAKLIEVLERRRQFEAIIHELGAALQTL